MTVSLGVSLSHTPLPQSSRIKRDRDDQDFRRVPKAFGQCGVVWALAVAQR